MRKYVTCEEVAEALRLSPATVRRLSATYSAYQRQAHEALWEEQAALLSPSAQSGWTSPRPKYNGWFADPPGSARDRAPS